MWKHHYLIKFKHFTVFKRCYSQESTKIRPLKYTDTINLPRTKFPQRLNALKTKEIEAHIRKTCLNDVYQWQQEHLKKPAYVLHDGPPYANGDLHMGHAINKILKDITLKTHLADGQQIHYKPGWDCHGLPIELKALNKTKIKSKLTPNEIRSQARQFASTTIETQKAEFEKWGITTDWSKSYKTFSKEYITNQLELFYKLYYNEKLIYRDLKPVYWSPSSETALAEAELEYDNNHESPSLYLRSPITNIAEEIRKRIPEASNLYSLIWTTTPWTLPANQAICYNDELNYCICKIDQKESDYYIVASDLLENLESELNSPIEKVFSFSGRLLENCKYLHPINPNEEFPFLSASHVQTNKGTGLVHTAPSHGPDDFLVYLEHKMSQIKCLVNEKGCYNNDAPEFLRSKNILRDGNNLVLDFVKENIVKIDKIRHSYPIDWRTKKPVIFRASEQWFINTNKIKNDALTEIDQVQIYPRNTSEINLNVLKTQLQKRPYWCISRQRSWGVPIPVFYNKLNGSVICTEEIITQLCEILNKTGNMDFWWEYDVEQLLPQKILNKLSLKATDILKGNDILDIWFDSGVSWYNALEGNKVADLYLEGVDQFTGWFQSSLMTSVGLRGIAPYKGIFVHGFAVDEKGHKMSKSLGNIILPSQITDKYSVDIMRWWIASHATQHASIPVSYKLFDSSAENVQKIRSVLKYLLGVIGQKQDMQRLNNTNNFLDIPTRNLKYLDKYMLHQLQEFHDNISQLYHSYQYNRVTATITNFLTSTLSGCYLHLIKDRLYCDNNDNYIILQALLRNSFIVLCKTLYPILPFLVEESWSYYDSKPFYHTMKNFKIPSLWMNNDSVNIIEKALSVRQLFNQLGNDINTWNLNVIISANTENIKLLKVLHPALNEDISNSELCEILQVSSVRLELSDNEQSEIMLKTVKSHLELCPRCRRFGLNPTPNNTFVCGRCTEVLQEKGMSG